MNKKNKKHIEETIKSTKDLLSQVDNEKAKNLKLLLLDLCDIIEKYIDDEYCEELVNVLEIIVFHVSSDPMRINLISDQLKNFDDVVFSIFSRTKDLLILASDYESLNETDSKISENENDEECQLNLFNPDGTKCKIEDLLDS